MPFVSVRVTREGSSPGVEAVTESEKARVIAGVSQVLLDVLGKPLESTFVVIEEVPLGNWGWGGMPVADYRATRAVGGSGSS
ncbi:tautomerase family protein [Crossiella cryophila]|uniref:tautomerase family protein n=1 Tax=Crossiella cryophila TaxID=43355 RepID=UPI001618D023